MKPVSMLETLGHAVRSAQDELTEHVKPRDETERAICNALGECSWDECVAAIQQYRSDFPARGEP